jgi:hypothetical protein
MMRKFIVFLCAMLCFVMGLSTVAFGAPEVGTWNELTLGLIDDFNGTAATLDPESNGGNVGDVTIGRDDSSSSFPGYGHYWFFNGLTRATLEEGPINDNGDGTGTATYHTTRIDGTFSIRGDHLWGHDPGTIYTTTMENESSGETFYNYDEASNKWVFAGYEGETHFWGYFDDYPYYIDFTAHSSIIDPHYWTDAYGWVILAELTNVEIEITTATLAFFDESVEAGTIEGKGRGWLANIRLFLMREMLEVAGWFIENDMMKAACFTLERACVRCDGDRWPLPDFVVGEATEKLEEMIQELMDDLGCE